MWDFSKLFPNSDNLYKFLFVGGLSLIVIGLFYPLSKQHELQLKKNDLELEENLLSYKINIVQKKIDELGRLNKKTKNAIDSLKSILSTDDEKNRPSTINKIQNLYDNYDSVYLQTELLYNESKESNIKLESNTQKIEILSEHVTTYQYYTYALLLVGIVLGFWGFIGWLLATFKVDKLRDQQIEKNRRELNANNNS